MFSLAIQRYSRSWWDRHYQQELAAAFYNVTTDKKHINCVISVSLSFLFSPVPHLE